MYDGAAVMCVDDIWDITYIIRRKSTAPDELEANETIGNKLIEIYSSTKYAEFSDFICHFYMYLNMCRDKTFAAECSTLIINFF